MKKGFTLVEIMAVLAILLIGGSLVFGVFTSSYKLINREKTLADIQDSFRNAVLDMEKEINDTDAIGYEIENIQIYNINSYEGIDPLLLIKKGESNILYFKGKKSNNNLDILEKIVFDNSSINNNTIYAKESKTIINEMNGDIALSSLVSNLIEVKFNFTIGNSKTYRDYSTTINLEKNENEEIVEIVDGTTQTTPNEPEIPDEPVTDTEVNEIANTFSKQETFIILDQNPYNSRENLINIHSMNGSNINIDVSKASFYIQAISTGIMKSHIDSISKISDNTFKEGMSMTKAPALRKNIYTEHDLDINGNDELKNILKVDNNKIKYIEKNGEKLGCMYSKGNQYVLLVNGNLNISGSDYIYLGADEGKSSHKLTIYATGKINIINNGGTVILKRCSLISANQININSNYIKVEEECSGDVGHIKNILDQNLEILN